MRARAPSTRSSKEPRRGKRKLCYKNEKLHDLPAGCSAPYTLSHKKTMNSVVQILHTIESPGKQEKVQEDHSKKKEWPLLVTELVWWCECVWESTRDLLFLKFNCLARQQKVRQQLLRGRTHTGNSQTDVKFDCFPSTDAKPSGGGYGKLANCWWAVKRIKFSVGLSVAQQYCSNHAFGLPKILEKQVGLAAKLVPTLP